MAHLRVAFLLTVAPVYWHPLLNEMARHVSHLRLFTAGWSHYAKGLENAFRDYVSIPTYFAILTTI
jgi:hypothetical protein